MQNKMGFTSSGRPAVEIGLALVTALSRGAGFPVLAICPADVASVRHAITLTTA